MYRAMVARNSLPVLIRNAASKSQLSILLKNVSTSCQGVTQVGEV